MASKKLAKIIGAIVVIAIVAGGGYAVYASTHNQSSENNNLVFSLSSTPPTMNPLYANSNSSLLVTDAIYEPLFNLNSSGSLEFNTLAKSLTHSEDCKIYTLTLKPNLKWSDGKDLTASDVAFTFNTMMNPKSNSVNAQTFMINGKPVVAKAVNTTTVEFTLPAASLSFEQNLASVYPIPEHIYKNVPVQDLKTSKVGAKPVGDGPYMFKSEEAGSTVTLTRNPNFEGEKAKVENVVFKVIPNANSGIAALESGQLSAGYLSQDLLKNTKVTDNYDTVKFGLGLVNTVIFNFENKNLQNPKVRQAIAYALNRQALIQAEYGKGSENTAANSVFSPETQYYNKDVTSYNYNPTKAEQLMKESGVKGVTLNLAYAAGFTWAQNQALIVKDDLAKIGITVELKPVALNSFFQEIFTPHNKDYDLAINGYNMGQTPDGYSTIFITDGSNNASNFSNKEIDGLFAKAQNSTSASERAKLYSEIQVKLSQELPLYTINYPQTTLGVSKKLGGVNEAKPTPIAMFSNFGALYYKN